MDTLVKLIEQLRDKNADVRSSAAEALGKIGEPAVKPLIERLGNEYWHVRSSAAYALGNIGDTRAVEPLILSLWDDDENILKYVSDTLKMIDPDWADKESTKKYLHYFAEALKKGNSAVKLYMIDVIEKIDDPKVPELLKQSLKDKDKAVRLRAARALNNIEKR